MASGLSIVIDTRNAELNIKNLNQALERLETQGNSVANMMRNLGGANPFAGLNAAVTSLKDSFNDFAGSTNTAKTAIKNLADGFTSAKTAIDNATTASNAFNDSVKKVYTSADILTNKIGALNGGFTVLSQKADTASSALSRFAQNATTTSSSMGGLISQSHTLAQNMANMGAASNTGANNTGTALARVNGALSNTQAQMNGFNNTARNTQNTFNQFNANIHNTQNNFTQLNNNVNLTRNSLTALSSVVTNNTTVINNYSRSAVSAAQSTAIFQRSAQGLESTLMRLQTLMTGGLFGMAALSIAKTADAMQGLENQVRLVTQGEEQREEVQRRLLVIANKNYADIEATTGSYQRNAFALAQLGKSQMDVLNFTDALSLAMRTGGRSMLEQKSAVYQLSQAMGAGKLMGDEFRALSENAPIILKYIAKEMGVAQGALKELGSEGKITSEIIYNAMMKARPEMEKMAQSLPITMSQAWQQINNSYKTFIDNFMNGTGGMSQGIASMLQGVGKNFDTIVKGMTIAGGLAFIGFASKIDIATKSMALFNLVANANPFVRMATIILAVSSAFYGLDDVINTTSVIMGDLIHMITDGWTGIFNLIGDGLNSLQGAVAQNNDDIGKSYKDMFTNATTDHDKFIANATLASNNLVKTISTDNMKNEQSYFGFYSRTQKGFLGFVEFVGTAVIAAVSTLGGFFKFIFNGIEDILKHMGNALMTAEEWIQRKLGNNVQYKRYDTFNNLSANQSYADVNSAGQKAWHGIIMPLSGQVRQKELATGGGDLNSMKDHDAYAAFLKQQEKERKEREENERKKREKNTPSLMSVAVEAAQDLGVTERTDPNRIMGYQRAIGYLSSRIDAWCGSFVGASLLKAGFAIPKNAASARAWEQYGVGYDKNKVIPSGAVATVARKGGSGRHVFIVEKDLGNGKVSTIEGNVGDKVVRNVRNKSQIITVRIPIAKDGQAANTNLSAKDYKGAESIDKNIDADYKKHFDEAIKLREQYGAKTQQIEADLTKKLEDVRNNTALSASEKDKFSTQAKVDAENELAIYRNTINQKISALLDFRKTQQQILDDKYTQDLFDAKHNKDLQGQDLTNYLDNLKTKYDFDTAANTANLQKQRSELDAYLKDERQLLADNWDSQIDEARLKFDDLSDIRIETLKAQKDRALEIFDLEQSQKLLDLQKFNMADIAYLEQTLKIKNDLIDKSNATQAMKDAQKAANEYETYNSVYDTRKSANDGYMSTYFDLYGQKDKYEAYKGADDKRIAQNDAVQKALDAGIIQHEEYYQTLKDIDAQYVANKQAILVGGYQSIFGSMTSLMSAFGGEQSRAYRIMANIEKGYALYSAFLSEKVALGKAWASAPFPQNLVAVAKVALESSSIIGAITAFAPKGFSTGGYTGNMGVNDVAGVVHGKEYVLNAAATKRIGVDNLNAMNRGSGVGNNNVSVNVVVNADGSSDVQANTQMGKQMGDAIKAAVLQTIVQEKRQGGLLSR